MVFSSLTFLFLFLPSVLAVYFLVPRQGKNAVLLAFSLLFYAWGEPVYLGLLLFCVVLNYFCARLIEQHRGTAKQTLALIVSICGNLGLLLFFKYSDFLIDTLNRLFGASIPLLQLPLPIGISFYSFQAMSYTIDVSRGTARAQRNFLSFGCYISLFPQLIAGPIVRYPEIADQLEQRTHSFEQFGGGAKRFVTGLTKKVLLANNIGLLWRTVSETGTAQLTTLGAWLGILAFAFQIYFDFSGYSDMAIGLGAMFGFSFPENFDYPYLSRSVTEFWRRWHKSLGSWFRDYVYIPLGGNRSGLPVQLRNIAIVWLLTGIWHGASWNFLLWGLFYGLLLVLEKLVWRKYLEKAPAIVGHAYTMFAVLLGWVLFAFDDLGKGLAFLGVLFGGGAGLSNQRAIYLLLSNLPLLAVCMIAATPLMKTCCCKLQARGGQAVWIATDCVWLLLLWGLSIAYLIGGSYNPFLYFRF